MNKLNGRIFRSLLLLTLLIAVITSQVEGRRRHPRRSTAAASAVHPQPPAFNLGCMQPALTKQVLAIDQTCGNIGNTASATSPGGLQNAVKNRFCLPGTTPTVVTFATFDQLQQAAKGVPFGTKKLANGKTTENLPTSRAMLATILKTASGKKIGEGTLVRLEGFVQSAHHSNTFVFHEGGESVNCNQKTLAANDIHIVLMPTQNETDECLSVTAEISPHHRSNTYNRFDTDDKDFLNGDSGSETDDRLTGKPLPLLHARVRVTGQLFFDASHSPCGINQGSSSQRRSIWEIHPVYLIEVFDTAKNDFVSFEKWAQEHSH